MAVPIPIPPPASIKEMQDTLLARYAVVLEFRGAGGAESLNVYQEVATLFGWRDTLAEMQRLAREQLR